MGYHGVHFLCLTVKIDDLAALFLAVGVGFFLFVWTLCGIIIRLFLEYFTLFHGVPGAMHQACFCTGRPIDQMDCMICLALASAALLRVGL